MVYVPTEEELYTHFKKVAEATSLPIMLYNNPPAYRVSISARVLEKLAGVFLIGFGIKLAISK